MKIKRLNEMNGENITKSDLFDWMLDHGEDVIVDGPFSLSEEQSDKFMNKCNHNSELKELFVEEGVIDDEDTDIETFSDLSVGGGADSSEIILDLFVEFLAEEGITEIPEY